MLLHTPSSFDWVSSVCSITRRNSLLLMTMQNRIQQCMIQFSILTVIHEQSTGAVTEEEGNGYYT